MITADVKDLIGTFPLGFVATTTPGGHPAVSPKGTFVVLDETTIAFGHIRSPGTLTNLEVNPACEVNFIDVLKRKGARLRGQTRILRRDTVAFDDLIEHWEAIWPDLVHRVQALILIDVDRVKTFVTPPYDDGATEAEMVAAYKAKLAATYPDMPSGENAP